MKLFPSLIVDNFFNYPDQVVEMALLCDYSPDPEGKWPGLRSQNIAVVYPRFFQDLLKKFLSIFYEHCQPGTSIEAKVFFQKINPYDKCLDSDLNKGWIHIDGGVFGGLVYLNKNPIAHSGTSLYTTNQSFDFALLEQYSNSKQQLYLESRADDYDSMFANHRSMFQQSVVIENLYNRLVLFDGLTWHAAQNLFQHEQSRLTLVFFINSFKLNGLTPLERVRAVDI